MLIQFTDTNGSPVYVNPRHVIAVREQKHFGRPGIASDTEYHDTLIQTTKHDLNVREEPDAVARELNRALEEIESADTG